MERDIEQISAEIRGAEAKLSELKAERERLIGFTAEHFALRKENESYIWHSIFKDSALTVPLFGAEEFRDLEDEVLLGLMKIYSGQVQRFGGNSLKKMALCPFFLNLYYLCDDNPLIFYGKSVVSLTFYQAELFGYGRYFKAILAECGEGIPADVREDPDKLVEWFEGSKNAEKLLAQAPEGSTQAVFGSKKDIQKLQQQGAVVVDHSKYVGKSWEEIALIENS